ncbi:MAG: dATP/dGTP diphosphohydrolase domain-containing protein [Candidatus Binataceae bacterium]
MYKQDRETGADMTATDLRRALKAVARTLDEVERWHKPDGWKHHSVWAHVEHAMKHLNQWFDGDKSENHLAHAATRLLMALELAEFNKSTNEEEVIERG